MKTYQQNFVQSQADRLTAHRAWIACLLLLVATILSACALPARAEVTSITIKGGDYTFEAPAQIQAGLVSITIENVGQETHYMQLVQLKEGVTPEQVVTTLAPGAAAVMPLLEGTDGGPGPIAPGSSQRITVRLAPGNYLLLCFLPDHEGVPHLAKGMVAPLTVVGKEPENQPEPAAAAMVKLVDFSFVLPKAIKAGEQTWKIVNEGSQQHELVLIKLAEDKTMEDLIAFYQSPHGQPPYEDAGGFQGIDPGKSGWLHLNLEPGTYVALCHVPDVATGKAHHELGMMLPFYVE